VTQRDSKLAAMWTYFTQGFRTTPQLLTVLGDPARVIARLGERWDRDEPADAQMPCLRLTAVPGVGGWDVSKSATQDRPCHSFPIVVSVESWVKGSDCRASMELFEASLAAMFPEHATGRAEWLSTLATDHGVKSFEINQAWWGSQPDGACIKGTGSFTIQVNLNT